MSHRNLLSLAVASLLFVGTTAQARVGHGYSNIFSIDTVTAVGENAGCPPQATTLEAIYPNPFNPRTTIEFTLAEAGAVELAVYDLRGRLVKVLDRQPRAIGRFQATWDGCDQEGRVMPAGTYICRLATSGGVQAQKLTLAK